MLRKFHTTASRVMKLKEVVDVLERLAPTSLAQSWDNVGLLVQPHTDRPITSILLTNDLTEPVLEEAIASGSELVISYHPPLFKALKRVTQGHWKERILARSLEEKIAVFSPHTSWDAVKGGINHWLVKPYGPGKAVPVETSKASSYPGKFSHSVLVQGVPVSTQQLQEVMSVPSISVSVDSSSVSISCPSSALGPTLSALPSEWADSVRITKHELPPLPDTGAGRLLELETPLTLGEAIKRTKEHLGLSHLRVATANGANLESPLRSIAVCAGSGASLLAGCKADLIVTGEMSHHEVLDFVHKKASVILTEHTNCERGYLALVKERLLEKMGPAHGVTIAISKMDRDPLTVL